MKPISILLFIALVLTPAVLRSQTAYEHISDDNIYSFIDDLASLQVIEANTSVKPTAVSRSRNG